MTNLLRIAYLPMYPILLLHILWKIKLHLCKARPSLTYVGRARRSVEPALYNIEIIVQRSTTYLDTHSSALRVKKICTAGRRVLFLFSFFGFSDCMRLILHRAKKIFSAVISHVCVAYKIAEKIRLH